MMILGPFRFSIDRLAYQEAARTSAYKWAEVERIGAGPAMQYVGRGADTLSLPGVFFPQWKGGMMQLPQMRVAAELGTPLPLITGYGFFLGLWVIESIEETQSVFFQNGVPRKVDFVITLKQSHTALDLVRMTIPAVMSAISRIFG